VLKPDIKRALKLLTEKAFPHCYWHKQSNPGQSWCDVGSMPSVYHNWQVTAWGKLSAVAGHHSFFRAVRSWRLSAYDGLGSGMGEW